MKKVFYFLVLIVFALGACSKKDNPAPPAINTVTPPSANSFSIQGDSFKNSSVNIRNIDASQTTENFDGSNTDLTIVGNGNATDSFSQISMLINFPGNSVTAGSEQITLLTVTFVDKHGTLFSYSSNGAGGSVTVTSYGKVGGLITGTFSYSNPGLPPANGTGSAANITNGKFSITRTN